MGKKKKRNGRKSPARRAVDLAEAQMLGLPLPVPKIHYCRFVPDTARDIASYYASVGLRFMAVELGIYKKPGILKGRPHRQIAEDVLQRLQLVTLDNAPGTTEGLIALGEHRVRYLVGLLVRDGYGPAHFLVGKGREDLKLEELVLRVLRGLKDWDKRNHRSRVAREAHPGPELFAPEKEEPAPAPNAKTLRLFDKGRKYDAHANRRISRNKNPHEVDATMRCGCLVRRTVSDPKGYFTVVAVTVACTGHAELAKGTKKHGRPNWLVYTTCHERELAREPRARRLMKDKGGRGRQWRKAS